MAVSADDLLQDIPCGFGPDEGLGIRQELQPFSVAMALLALPDDLTIQYVECSELR